jgi:hypothetical protein
MTTTKIFTIPFQVSTGLSHREPVLFSSTIQK